MLAAGALALAGVLAGCGASGGEDGAAGSDPTSGGTTSRATTDGTCPDADAVGEAAGREVQEVVASEGEGSGEDLTYTYEGCEIYFADFDGAASFERLTVTDAVDGRTAYEALEAWARVAWATDGFEPVDDLGGEAYRDGPSLVLRDGPAMIFAGVLRGDAPADVDLAGPTRELARALLDVDLRPDVALSELCPLVAPTITATVGPTTTTVVREGRPGLAGGPGGETVYWEEVTCRTEQADGSTVSIAVTDAAVWDDWVTAQENPEFGAAYEPGTLGEHAAFTNEVGLFVDDDVAPLRVQLENVEGTPEELDELRRELATLVVGG